MNHAIKRMLIEALGWVLAAIGIYFVFEKNTSILPYILLIIGIILILLNFPYKDFKRKKS